MKQPELAQQSGFDAVPVAVLMPTGEVGGHERMLFEWLSQAQELGLRPTVHCARDSELVEMAREYGLACGDAGYVGGRTPHAGRARWANLRETYETALQQPRDTVVLLAPGTMQTARLHTMACLLAGRRVACYVPMTHGSAAQRIPRAWWQDWVTGRLAARIALWITVSDEQGRRLESLWRVRAPVYVIPNRLRIMANEPGRCERPRTEPPRLTVVYAGRFEANQKGLDWLEHVLRADSAWQERFRFVFQGRGEFAGRLENLAREMGTEHVRVLPWGDIRETLAGADLMLLPSRFEGMPLIAVEAAWAGVPVVATEESGLTDVLPPGCVFRFGDVAGFWAALERMCSSGEREAAVAHARRRLSVLLDRARYRDALRDVVLAFARVNDEHGRRPQVAAER